MGLVKLAAMTEPGWGKRSGGCSERWPRLTAVELQVNPPNAGDAHHTPEGHLAGDDGQRQVLEEEEVREDVGEEEGQAEEEDESMGDGGGGGERRGDGEEGRDAGGWRR